MTEAEYYELPLGVADRLELQHFLLADHWEGAARADHYGRAARVMEAQSTNEVIDQWIFQLTHKTNDLI